MRKMRIDRLFFFNKNCFNIIGTHISLFNLFRIKNFYLLEI